MRRHITSALILAFLSLSYFAAYGNAPAVTAAVSDQWRPYLDITLFGKKHHLQGAAVFESKATCVAAVRTEANLAGVAAIFAELQDDDPKSTVDANGCEQVDTPA